MLKDGTFEGTKKNKQPCNFRPNSNKMPEIDKLAALTTAVSFDRLGPIETMSISAILCCQLTEPGEKVEFVDHES